MARTSQKYSVGIIILTVYLVGFLSTTQTTEGHEDNDYDESVEFTYPPDMEIEATTPVPEHDESLSCEKIHDTLNEDMSFVFKQDITELVRTYNDWGKLLAPAPVAIGILGQLIVMANQLKDFPINSEDPDKTFKHIKYPNSLRTTLLQISQSGYKAFLKAHTNMDAIRLHNNAVPSDIKDAFRYIMSNNSRIIELRLPPVMTTITEVAQKSQNLSKEVVDEFNLVLDLIVETQGAVNSTSIGAERRLEYALLDIRLEHEAKKSSEKENLILMKKDTYMRYLLKRYELRKGRLPHTSVYGGAKFTINLANDWVEEIGQERYKKDEKLLHNKNNRWINFYRETFVDSNSCAQKNSQQLLDLLIAFGEYRKRYEHWQNVERRNKNPLKGSQVITNIERALKNLIRCPDIENIITKGADLMNKLKSPNAFESLKKMDKRPGETEIKDIVKLVGRLRKSAMNVHEISGKKRKIVTSSGWDMLNVTKHQQLNQLENMTLTVKEILKLNMELVEIRKEKTQQILNRIATLDITKGNIEYVIRVLKEGLLELGKLKHDWEMLIKFFEKIRTFISNASRHTEGLISILNHLSSENRYADLQADSLYQDLMDNIEKSEEASFLVHGIADMYVNVSTIYIMDRMARLNTMNSLGVSGVTNDQLKEEKAILTKDAVEASKGIEDYVLQHEKEMTNALDTQHVQIFKEYQKLTKCLRNKGIASDNNKKNKKWFQIKSRLSDKVLEVSPETDSNGTSLIQIWDALSIDNHQQIWYLGENNSVQSILDDFCLTSHGEYSASVTVEPCNATNAQQWTVKDDLIVNNDNPNDCLNIMDENQENGALVTLNECPRNERDLHHIFYVFSIKPTRSVMILDNEKQITEDSENPYPMQDFEYYDN